MDVVPHNHVQVLRNKVSLLQALRACLLHETITVHTLHYHVKRAEQNGGMHLSGSVSKHSKEGMVIDITTAGAASTTSAPTDKQTSPLTETSSSSFSVSTKRTRKTSKQAGNARIEAKREREDYNRRFKEAFKEATRVVQEKKEGKKPSRETAQQVVTRLNAEYNLNGKRKLSKSTVYREVKKGNIGRSPPKKGPPTKIPDILLDVVATHSEVCQVGNGGELRGQGIKRLLGAAVLGTKYEKKFTIKSAWRKLRSKHPERITAGGQVSMEDARSKWTTHDNLQQWFNDAKNHDLSITGDKGGSRSVVYHNPNYQRGYKRSVKAGRHVTGVYATNAAGEALPPMYIFDSGAKLEQNFRVKTTWLEGLPVIKGRFGCPELIEESSFFSVRSRGSMDDSLFIEYIEKVVLPLYPNISKTTEFDPVNGKLLRGPVILKVDSGPGRIVASEESIAKRADFLEMGLYILMGLPNATSVQQEMDALYGAFKSSTYARGEVILMEKMRDQANRRNRMIEEEADHEDDEATEVHEETDGANTVAGRAEGLLSLGFNDLATVVNGKEGEDASLRPFDKCFTKENILSSWRKVGFVPFTRMCLKNKKVRHELGQQEKNVEIEELKEEYDDLIALSNDDGINAGLFDAYIPFASRAKRVEDDAEQVKKLLATRGAFSTSTIWNVCGSRIGNSRVTLQAQKEQLAIDAAKAAAQLRTRTDRQQKILANAQTALAKYRACSESLTDKDWIDIIRWVLPESKAEGLMKDLKKKAAIVAKLATLEREWTTYIPLPQATKIIRPLPIRVVDKLKALGLNFTINYLDFTFAVDVTNFFQRVFVEINTTEASASHYRPRKNLLQKSSTKHISFNIAPFYTIHSPYDAQSNSASIHVLQCTVR